MALYRYSLYTNNFHKKNLSLLFYLLQRYTSKSSKRNIHKNDTLDVYTDNLLQESGNKWNNFVMKLFLRTPKLKINSSDSYENKELLIDTTEEEIQTKIIDCIRDCDFTEVLFLVKLSKERSYNLESNFILHLVQLFAKLGNREGVEVLLSLYKDKNEKDFEKKSQLQYYIAQVLWYSGGIEESFEILEKMYRDNLSRQYVNFVMYDIISNSVVRNEVFLVLVTKFVQKLVNRYDNYYPISILWKMLCESEYFADNQLARKLLHNNKKLIAVICPLIPFWSAQLINCHKIDVVHRLGEVLLENNALDYYSSVLHSLFDYYYYQSNLKRCSAVVKSSLDLQIPLKDSYQKRFLILLTTGKPDTSHKTSTLPKRIEYQINLKF